MQQQFQSDKTEDSLPPQVESVAALQTTAGIETEADKLTAQTVTERLTEIENGSKRAIRRFRIGVGMLGAWTLTGAIVLAHLAQLNLYVLPVLFLIFAVQFIWLPLQLWICKRSAPKFDAADIAKQGGVQAIAPLFAAAQVIFPKKRRRAIMGALTTLLPRMKATDAHLLTPTARNRIRDWLSTMANTVLGHPCSDDLRIAALKALEQVGDTDDIPVVTRLANMHAQTSEQTRVKQAAIECLPMLRSHCGEVAAARTLLRAANAEDARPDTLLRAASSTTKASAAELLRGTKKP